jgi:hypothetical protein
MTTYKPSAPPEGASLLEYSEWVQSEVRIIEQRYDRRMRRIFRRWIAVYIILIGVQVAILLTGPATGASVFTFALQFSILSYFAYQYGYHSYRPTKP